MLLQYHIKVLIIISVSVVNNSLPEMKIKMPVPVSKRRQLQKQKLTSVLFQNMTSGLSIVKENHLRKSKILAVGETNIYALSKLIIPRVRSSVMIVQAAGSPHMADISQYSAVRIHAYVLKRFGKIWSLFSRMVQRSVPGSLRVTSVKCFEILAFSPHGKVMVVDGRRKLFPVFMVEVGHIIIEDAVVIRKGKLFWRRILLRKCGVVLLAV